jgi:transcriptional regulator with XRE-family HTH domain
LDCLDFAALNPGYSLVARAALKLSVRELAKMAQVATGTIVHLEAGETPQPRTIDVIRHALEKAGVVFTNGDEPGVRLKKR